MITHPAFTTEAWKIHEAELHLDILEQTESIFALANGHVGMRGNFDEGEPYGLPGTYLNSVYELRPLPYAEIGYGYPESGQTIINVTNGKLLRLLVDDEPFDLRYGELKSHERELDLREGVLRRNVCWTSPAGRTVKVSSVRMVSFMQRAIAAINYEVEVVDASARIVVQSELVANEVVAGTEKEKNDPRAGIVSLAPLESEEHQAEGTRGLLIHHTHASGLRLGAAMDHHIEGPKDTSVVAESSDNVSRISVISRLEPGEKLRIVKFLAYGWSSQRSQSAVHDQIIAALAAARETGWEGLLDEQRKYLDDFWAHSDVELEGDDEIQQALRFALFHVLQAGARGERRPIPAKGLTGPGYDGHVFWDTEMFVLPILTLTSPQSSADALRWRHSILDQAREHARQFGLRGAAFPWRTIQGAECSSYWPAGTAAFHINADIAYATTFYIESTGDKVFEEEVGAELLIETARLWASLGYRDALGRFHIDGITGPDEYSAIVDDNVYTNLMAQHNLQAAADAAKRYPHVARTLKVHADEIKDWKDAAKNMFIPYDRELKITPQDASFTEHEVWDFAHTKPEQYPLLLNFPYFDLYRKQVCKQADLVLAMQLFSEVFTLEQKKRNFAYYEPLTVRDSSLSASTQAVIATEVGQLDLAYDYLGEAALMDLNDLEHNTRNGLHMASLAGTWNVLVAGFGGLRFYDSSIRFAPRLPDSLKRLAFHIVFQGRHLFIEVTPKEATYTLLDGESLKTKHYNEVITLTPNKPVTRAIRPIKTGPRPSQPPGRGPIPRGELQK